MIIIGFLTETIFLGARLVYWLYLFLAILGAGGIFAYWQREAIRKFYYSLRFPERLIKIRMIYPNNNVNYFWRLIPDTTDKTFSLDGGTYDYNDETILKNNSWFAYREHKTEGRLIVRVSDKEYFLDDLLKIKNRWERWPEMTYKFGCPFPVDYNSTKTTEANNEITFNASDLEKLKKSTILTQIYNSVAQDSLIIFIIILAAVNIIISGFLLAKIMGWLK